MAFVKEFRDYSEEMPEWNYLNSIGVRSISGEPIEKNVLDMVLDRERNYYLIPIGHQGLAYNKEAIDWYVLVVDDKKIELEVIDGWCNDESKEYIENHWEIRKIKILDPTIKEVFKKQEIIEIIKESFEAESVFSKDIPKKRGVIEINISCEPEDF